MGIASLILGIISLLIGWIPFVCFFMFALAIVGLILGAIDVCKKSKIEGSKKGFGIAGLVISAVAIPIIVISSMISIAAFAFAINDDLAYENDDNYYENSIFERDYNGYWREYYDTFLENHYNDSI